MTLTIEELFQKNIQKNNKFEVVSIKLKNEFFLELIKFWHKFLKAKTFLFG